MSFRTRRVLFASPFFALLEYFLLKYLFSLLNIANDLLILLIVLFLWMIHVIPMFFEEKKSTPIGRFFATIDGVWTWILVMLLIYLVFIYILDMIFKIPTELSLLFLLTIPIIGAYAYYNAHNLVVKEKVLELEKIDREYNIVHLSDVHFGSIRHKDVIRDISVKLCELSDTCDFVVVSGDLADGSCAIEEDDFVELKKVNMPIIFTSGNHDYYPGLDNVHKACKKAGIIILENNGMKYENINVYGLSFSFDDIPMPTIEELKSFIDEDMINIVNYHIPNGWNQLSRIGFNIQLSGHTHGGQFYPAIWFGNLMYEGHNMGLYKDSLKHYLHVTTGVGSMDIPMRWGTNSEIVILKFRKVKQNADN